MRFSPNTPVKGRAIQSELYAADGQEEFVFNIRRPFNPEHFEHLGAELGIDPVGFSNGANQLFAENMSNNMATRIKTINKFNEELAAAQEDGKRLGETLKPLPTQEDMDELMAAYDFSGVRMSSGESSAVTPFQREMYSLAKKLITAILKAYGVDDKEAPVRVARANTPAGANTITPERFAELVDEVVEGTGVWATGRHATKREELIAQAEANVAATKLDADPLSLDEDQQEAA
jgi:hypothetical protein